MDDKNKRTNENPMASPSKLPRLEEPIALQTPDLQQMQSSHQGFFSTLAQSINSKMSNIAKLRQQFVDEVKSIELSQKESIKDLKQKICEGNQKVSIYTIKLKEANELLCNQSEIIYKKEEENKVLRDKVAELFGHQKILYENMEAISNILCTHESLSNHLANEYDHVMLTQDNDITTLEEKLRKLIPDENLLSELDELNLKINELEREVVQYERKSTQLESELNQIRIEKDNEQKLIQELDKKIIELETKNNSMKEKASKEKIKLISDLQKIDIEVHGHLSKKQNLETQNSELKEKIEKNKCQEKEILKQFEEANNEFKILLQQHESLITVKSKNEQENEAKVDKLKSDLKSKKTDLENSQNSHKQATTIMKNKIFELQQKLAYYDGIEMKLQKIETEISKENELHLHAIKSCDEKKKELMDKINSISAKISESKLKLSKTERDISEAEEKIRLLEKEIRELNQKYEIKLKTSEECAEKVSSSQSFNKHELPNPFMSEGLGRTDKAKNRTKIFTPTLADNDLDIDSLTLEEQVTHLTQVPTSSPDKTRKFFKRTTSTQPKPKRETIPKGRGRGKKY